MYFDLKYSQICSQGFILTRIGSDNEMAPNRWQASIWSNDVLDYVRHSASNSYSLLFHDKLTLFLATIAA